MSNAPMLSPEWQIDGGFLQYKPYPRYPDWITAFDLTEIFTNFSSTIDSRVGVETERALAAESALDARITALENP